MRKHLKFRRRNYQWRDCAHAWITADRLRCRLEMGSSKETLEKAGSSSYDSQAVGESVGRKIENAVPLRPGRMLERKEMDPSCF